MIALSLSRCRRLPFRKHIWQRHDELEDMHVPYTVSKLGIGYVESIRLRETVNNYGHMMNCVNSVQSKCEKGAIRAGPISSEKRIPEGES
jgi:hypothetical protein